MIVFCEECGKKYQIDPSKIKGEQAKAKCQSCGHSIAVSKGGSNVHQPSNSPPGDQPLVEISGKKPAYSEAEGEIKRAKVKASKTSGLKSRRFGLRARFMLFILAPIIVIYCFTVFLSMKNMAEMQDLAIKESSKIISRMAEDMTVSFSRMVAAETKNYILGHPDLKKEDFNNNIGLKELAEQKVGLTGYTYLYSVPDENALSTVWVHPDTKLIGPDLPKAMLKRLGKGYKHWWNIHRQAYEGKEAMGYYTWQDDTGKQRERFMVCAPIKGTDYVIATTLYVDELRLPVKKLEREVKGLAQNTRKINAMGMAAGFLAVALILSLYGRSITRKIRFLSEVTERISVGELGAEIKIKSKDEIGDLADAISRMQESIRISIERLRGRKQNLER